MRKNKNGYKEEADAWLIKLAIVGIIGIVILESIAILILHIDGILLSGIIGSISGIIGFVIREITNQNTANQFIIFEKKRGDKYAK